MKIRLLTWLFLLLSLMSKAQRKLTENTLGVSMPVIWNNSEALYYTLGNPNRPNGNAISYGLNINYSKTIYKNFFALIGIGNIKQKFGIKRPFNYVAPDSTKPVVYTKYYWYQNIYWLLGIGYEKALGKNLSLKGVLSYNNYHSYKQKYAQKYFPGINEMYRKSVSTGSMVNLDLGMNWFKCDKVSVGGNIILPVDTYWGKDDIFYNSYFSGDEQRIAHNKFSIGVAISCCYYF